MVMKERNEIAEKVIQFLDDLKIDNKEKQKIFSCAYSIMRGKNNAQ